VTGGDGWGNSELEYYSADSSNAYLDGHGHLAITALPAASSRGCWYGACKYTSARLTTLGKFSFTYGRVEARIKIPSGRGLWPAFWMLGRVGPGETWPAGGEIDVMENIGSEPGTIHGSLHGPGYSGANDLTASYTLAKDRTFAAGFHTFRVDWSPSMITFSVDGNDYERQTPRTARGHDWVFDRPFSLLLNLAVGGSWPGNPDASTRFPATMLIDSVSVYQGRE
jgi:beta-glucanase (GH16 family)